MARSHKFHFQNALFPEYGDPPIVVILLIANKKNRSLFHFFFIKINKLVTGVSLIHDTKLAHSRMAKKQNKTKKTRTQNNMVENRLP